MSEPATNQEQDPAAGATARRVRIIGNGRAGGSLAGALRQVGWWVDMADRASEPATSLRDVELLVLAVPDDAISALARSVEPGEGVVAHLSGSRTLEVLSPHERRMSIHPLMTLPDADIGARRLLDRCSYALSGDPIGHEVVAALGGTSFTVDDADRVRYHATASVAANHVVALLGQVERLCSSLGIPAAAFWQLARASLDNVEAVGAANALTGPAARGDWSTIRHHLGALPDSEVELYRNLASAAAALAGNDWPTDLD